MTISTLAAKSRYAGDGTTVSFPTGFKFLDDAHVRVVLQAANGSERIWTEGSEYSLSGAGAPGGGSVEVITSPVDHTPAPGETLVVKLAVPERQETSLPLCGASRRPRPRARPTWPPCATSRTQNRRTAM